MQYWFEQAIALAQSAPLEVVVPSVLCMFFAKKILKLVVGLLKFGTIAALAVLMFTYVSKQKNIETLGLLSSNQNYSQLAGEAKQEVGERLIILGERLKDLD